MSAGLQFSLAILASALLGSIPFSLLIARYVGGIDLRKHGSGNVGATNVARTMGPKWGTVALLLDAFKGGLPTWLFPALMTAHVTGLANEQTCIGAGAVIGHMFSPFLNFKGGKGVATALGVICVMAPLSSGCALGVFLVTFFAFRIVSLSSIIASLSYAVVEFSTQGWHLWSNNAWARGVFAVVIPSLILLRHRANIVRLWQGTEPRLQFKKSGGDIAPDAKSAESTEAAKSSR